MRSPHFFQGNDDDFLPVLRPARDDVRLGHREGDRPVMRWWLVLALALGGIVASPAAFACTKTSSGNYTGCADQGAAYAAAMTIVSTKQATCTNVTGPSLNATSKQYVVGWSGCPGNASGSNTATWTGGLCTSRETGPGGSSSLFLGVSGAMGTCYNGCMYAMGSAGTTYKLGASNKSVMTSTGLAPTGDVCSDTPVVSQDEQCVEDGTLTQCVKPDGTHCATASNGVQICWGKDESGVKLAPSGNDAATKSPEGKGINAPRTPPANGGDWEVIGQSTTTITNNDNSTTYNQTNYSSSYGSSGSGSTGGSSGSGSDGGDSGGGDDGGDDDNSNDPGGVGDGASGLYEGTSDTVAGLIGEYYGKVTDTPILASVKSFMLVDGGGSCPVFSLPASQWLPALSFDAHCSGTVYSILQLMGWVLLGIVSYYSVRIAVN